MFFADAALDGFARGFLLTIIGISWIVLLVRINGLRSFSKMTNFDFVMTVAVGSLLAGAGQSTSWSGFAQVLTAITALFLFQYLVARLRIGSRVFRRAVQNKPVLLVRDGEVLDQALADARVSKGDLIAKLREANVLDMAEVRAVVLETTGDISVLHGESCAEELLRDVRTRDR